MNGLPLPPSALVGKYFQSAANPEGRDPTTGGYFGPLDPAITNDKNWAIEFKLGASATGEFKIKSHTVVNGNSRYVLTKKKPSDTWPLGAPNPIPAGWTVQISWILNVEGVSSSRYKDTVLELFKKEASDPDWVLVTRKTAAIEFNSGLATSTKGNLPGWSNFGPTGYSNIDDNSAPGTRTIYTRFAEIILSHQDIT